MILRVPPRPEWPDDSELARPSALQLEEGVPDIELEPTRYLQLLAIRVAHEPYALRMGELGGVFERRPITPLPSPLPELRGLAAIRGHGHAW